MSQAGLGWGGGEAVGHGVTRWQHQQAALCKQHEARLIDVNAPWAPIVL